MPIQYKIDVVAALRDAGYNSNRIRKDKIMGESYMQQLRRGQLVSWSALTMICKLLDCQPGDILEYVPDDQEAE